MKQIEKKIWDNDMKVRYQKNNDKTSYNDENLKINISNLLDNFQRARYYQTVKNLEKFIFAILNREKKEHMILLNLQVNKNQKRQ
jgi:hypothetical protein